MPTLVSIVQLVEQWIVAPKAVGSRPSSYPLNTFSFFKFFNSISNNLNHLNSLHVFFFLKNLNFVPRYYQLNELIWQDGFLLDFLQKKTLNSWIKKFVILSGNLFSEKLLFDALIKFYLNTVVYPLNFIFIFEVTNVYNLLFFTIFTLISIFFFIVLALTFFLQF